MHEHQWVAVGYDNNARMALDQCTVCQVKRKVAQGLLDWRENLRQSRSQADNWETKLFQQDAEELTAKVRLIKEEEAVIREQLAAEKLGNWLNELDGEDV